MSHEKFAENQNIVNSITLSEICYINMGLVRIHYGAIAVNWVYLSKIVDGAKDISVCHLIHYKLTGLFITECRLTVHC
jgi:hypothetical protein